MSWSHLGMTTFALFSWSFTFRWTAKSAQMPPRAFWTVQMTPRTVSPRCTCTLTSFSFTLACATVVRTRTITVMSPVSRLTTGQITTISMTSDWTLTMPCLRIARDILDTVTVLLTSNAPASLDEIFNFDAVRTSKIFFTITLYLGPSERSKLIGYGAKNFQLMSRLGCFVSGRFGRLLKVPQIAAAQTLETMELHGATDLKQR